MAEPRLTRAQSEALRVLAMEGRARISNVTRPRDGREPCIYWQSWVALKGLGYASPQPATGCHAEITGAGRGLGSWPGERGEGRGGRGAGRADGSGGTRRPAHRSAPSGADPGRPHDGAARPLRLPVAPHEG